MKKPTWTVEKIKQKCKELNVEFLDNTYKHDIKNKFRCACGNTFERLFLNVVKGQILCNECANKRNEERRKEKLKEKYYEFKRYVEIESNSSCTLLSPLEDYQSNKSKMKVKCLCGNIFYPTANNFKKGHHRCMKCSRKEIGKQRRKDINEIKAYVESFGYTLINYKFTNEHRLTVKCDVQHHKPYEVSYGNFYSGHRCPACNVSKGEKRVEDFLKLHNFSYSKEYTFNDLVGKNRRKLKFDFAVFKNNDVILIEYDGEQHFKPKFGEEEFERTKRNDKIKNEYCKNRKLQLIRIPYTEFDNIENILLKTLVHADTERGC